MNRSTYELKRILTRKITLRSAKFWKYITNYIAPHAHICMCDMDIKQGFRKHDSCMGKKNSEKGMWGTMVIKGWEKEQTNS